jgi:class 3 adenylate cyclase/cell division septation protein DedD/predicted Ser/Thr protein kinase
MVTRVDDVDSLLKARAEIDERLRRHKSALTVLFTDVAGSTGFFERNGDTAGLAMIHRHDKLATSVVTRHGGRVLKTIGDSAMAEFTDPAAAVRAAVDIERQFLKLNQTLPADQRVEVRIGIHSGVGYRKANDLFGDVVNVAARIVKRTAPAQILISQSVYEAVKDESDLQCQWLNKFTIDGRTEKEDIFEVVWTNTEAYREMRERLASPSGIPSRFQLVSQVGSGGVGVVYKVRDPETDEIVAIKILKPEIASDPAVQENFKRELRLSRKITHKNVCRIYDFCRADGMAYASMEFIEGESLLARLNRAGSVPVDEAIEIVRQICAGLREAHAQGIVHRDLKPANIMLDRSGTVKIMDFGVARLIQGTGPMTGTIVGTPAYMAPEQADLKPVSACTDIYSLGLVLYEMVTGAPAFSGEPPVAVALKQIREYPKRPREIVPNLSPLIEAVIMKCIQKDSAKRYQSVDELVAALHRAAKARPVPAWRASLERELRKAETRAGQVLRRGTEEAVAFLKRWEWHMPTKIQKRFAAAIVAPVLLGGVISFAMYRGAKGKSGDAQSGNLSGGNFIAPLSTATTQGAVKDVGLVPTREPVNVLLSHDVDLNRDPRSEWWRSQSFPAGSPNDDLASEPTASARSRTSRTAKRDKTEVRTVGKVAQPNAKVSSQPLEVATTPQFSALTLTGATQPAASEEAASPAQQKAASPEPVVEQASLATEVRKEGAEPKTPNLFLDAGSFKDETWANAAVEKLTQLGYRAIVIHKNLLWSHSYQVEVGPYTAAKDIDGARQNLATQGFKTRPIK